MKSQPKGAAPVSRDVVEGVKRKMAPPPGPPPAGMLSFNAPKHVQSKSTSDRRRYDEYDNEYDDGYDDHGDGHYDEDEDYYSDDQNNETSRRSKYEDDGRDYHYDGGHGRRGEQLDDNDYDREHDRGSSERPAYDNRSGENGLRTAHVEKASTDSLNASAQSKQFGGMSLSHPAEGKAVAEAADAKVSAVEVKKELTGPATQIVSTYLQRSRTMPLNYQPVLHATYRELKYYVTSPCPPGFTANCYIERNRTGSKMLAPYYSICADLGDGTGRELMVCRKVMRSRSPHYIFSLKSEDLWRKREQRSRLYLGKLRATSANDYVLYDNGICEAPEEGEELLVERERDNGAGESDVGADRDTVLARKMARDRKGESGMPGTGSAEDVSLYRSELVAIHFGSKTRPAPAGKRGTEICLPHNFQVDSSGKTTLLGKAAAPPSSGANSPLTEPKGGVAIGVVKPNAPMYNIVKPFEKVRGKERQNDLYSKSCFVLHERTSRYDPLSSCLVDFKGRANMASVKNCQFVVSEPGHEAATAEAQMKIDSEKDFVMQLGKTTDDCFNMDYRYPLSLLQAFSICIARFDAKLTW